MVLGSICSVLLALLGALLVAAGAYLGFFFLPDFVDNQIEQNVVLEYDTIQMERFLETPVALDFKVTFFNITNGQAVIAGAVPHVHEVGPYIYKQFKTKEVFYMEENNITFREFTRFEFDAARSYPLTEQDVVTIVNVPYNAILQGAEVESPGLLVILNPLLNQVFGAENNRPIFTAVVRDIMFDGIHMCQNPNFLGRLACDPILESVRDSENMRIYDDNSFSFSFFFHKGNDPTRNFTVDRGLTDSYDLGRILTYDNEPYLSVWGEPEEEGEVSYCNMINGTDSAIYRPFLNRSEPLRAFNPDICRSVVLRYQYDTEYEGIPAVRFAAGPEVLSGEDQCFCLNATRGVTQEDGCLYPGVMELFSCTGAHMVFSSPHFLYGDIRYRNDVIGMNPQPEEHQIFLELEPNSGTILRGSKRAQFNLFLRPIPSITGTNNLRTTLTPILWVEDGMELPDEFVDEVKSTLLRPMRLISIIRIVVIVLGCVMTLLGIWLTVRLCTRSSHPDSPVSTAAASDNPTGQNNEKGTT